MRAKDFVKEWGLTIADAALLVLGFSLDHQNVLSGWFKDWYPAIQPVGLIVLGALGGYSVAWTLGRRVLAKETGQRDTRIASLEAEITAVRAEYENPARRLRETAGGLSPLGKAVLARILSSDSFVTLDSVGDAYHEATSLKGLGLLRLVLDEDYDNGQPNPPVRASVSPEVRNALDYETRFGLEPYLSRLETEVEMCVMGTFENSVAEAAGLRQGAAIAILLEDAPQLMRVHLFEALAKRLPDGVLVSRSVGSDMVEVTLDDDCRPVVDRVDLGFARMVAGWIGSDVRTSRLEKLEILIEGEKL